jgi:hypothetical protein
VLTTSTAIINSLCCPRKASTTSIPVSFQAQILSPLRLVPTTTNTAFGFCSFKVQILLLIQVFFNLFLLWILYSVLRRSTSKDEPLIDGLPKEYYDDVCSRWVFPIFLFCYVIDNFSLSIFGYSLLLEDSAERVFKFLGFLRWVYCRFSYMYFCT